jgi:predicted adenine nucleotide alpha hydrolase (AANH) superfamily ATPase
VRLTVAPYDADAFDALSRGFEYEREGGERCARCIRYRMERAAMRARDTGGKYFGTTLSVSPHKSSPMIHEIGDALEREYGVKYLRADFKKRGGYASSVRRSKMYGLYRQSYCGCRYSIYK